MFEKVVYPYSWHFKTFINPLTPVSPTDTYTEILLYVTPDDFTRQRGTPR